MAAARRREHHASHDRRSPPAFPQRDDAQRKRAEGHSTPEILGAILGETEAELRVEQDSVGQQQQRQQATGVAEPEFPRRRPEPETGPQDRQQEQYPRADERVLAEQDQNAGEGVEEDLVRRRRP